MLLLAILLTFCCLRLNGQSNKPAIIRGNVIEEESKKPLAGASVYLAYKKIGAIVDSEGKFEFTSDMSGKYELTVSMVGFGMQKKNIVIERGREYNFSFVLSEQPVEINPVEIVVDDPVEWKKNLKIFLSFFARYYAPSDSITYSNVEYLDFRWINGFLAASTNHPVKLYSRVKKYSNDLRLLEFAYDPSNNRAVVSHKFWFDGDTITYKNKYMELIKADWLNKKKK